MVFICQKCGANLPEEVKFCSNCGGNVIACEAQDVKFVCSNCGKEFPEKWNFCHDCAGKIVTQLPFTYRCEGCGKEFETETKFCSACGGKVAKLGGIIGGAPAAEFCPGCGQNTLVDGFCTNCGFKK